MSFRETPHVAVLVDTATGWGRRLVQGVCDYSRRHGPWHLLVQAKGQDEPLRVPKGWRGDGVIARLSDPQIARHVLELGVPTVNISGVQLSGVGLPTVTTDVGAVADLAVEHFLARGFRHFAYSAAERASYVQEHREAFAQAVGAHGYDCLFDGSAGGRRRVKHHTRLLHGLMDWLRDLPKPVAVFTWGTQRGLDVLEACWEAELVVPHEVAVLGGDYDDVLCEASSPPMSGVVTASEQIGHEASAMLAELLAGHDLSRRRVLLPPTGIAEKPSTQTLAVDDPDLVQVMRFIDQKACEPIQMNDILAAVPVARRTLERKFKQTFGRSPTDEIRHRRIARSKLLLAETDMTLPAIAEACGFCTYAYLSHVFKKETGVTPSAYRKQIHGH